MNRTEIRNELRKWMLAYKYENPYMLTVKMKTTDKVLASKHLRFFRNRYARSIGRRDRDYVFIPMLETPEDNYHYHVLVERPKEMSHEKYLDSFHKVIAKVKQTHRDHNDITEAYTIEDAVGYMTKMTNKDDELDAINLKR